MWTVVEIELLSGEESRKAGETVAAAVNDANGRGECTSHVGCTATRSGNGRRRCRSVDGYPEARRNLLWHLFHRDLSFRVYRLGFSLLIVHVAIVVMIGMIALIVNSTSLKSYKTLTKAMSGIWEAAIWWTIWSWCHCLLLFSFVNFMEFELRCLCRFSLSMVRRGRS